MALFTKSVKVLFELSESVVLP